MVREEEDSEVVQVQDKKEIDLYWVVFTFLRKISRKIGKYINYFECITNFSSIKDREQSKKIKNKEVHLVDHSILKVQRNQTGQDNRLIRTKRRVKDNSVNDSAARAKEVDQVNQKIKEKWKSFLTNN